MTIEMACLETRRIKTEDLEEKLNNLAKKGWRVKCTVNTSVLILTRDVLFPGIKDSL